MQIVWRNKPFAVGMLMAALAGLLTGLIAASQLEVSVPLLTKMGTVGSQSDKSMQSSRLAESSKNVIRAYGSDVYGNAVAASQLVFAGSRTDAHPDAKPGVAILVPSAVGGEPFYAEALAAAALIHHPRNGPVLFTDPSHLNAGTAAELRRLSPTGGPNWPQVFVVGRLSEAVEDEVRGLGLGTERLSGADPYETAALIDQRLGRQDNVMIVRGDDPSHALPSVSWLAHMGDSSLLFTERDTLPDATVRALQARSGPFTIYILGPEQYISATVAQQLQSVKGVQAVTRIAGADPSTTAVAFARFKQGTFGWGIENAGHSFYFVALGSWQDAVAGALTSHLGGHGPLLLTETQVLPQETRRYLESVRPAFPDDDPTKACLNRAYLIASPENVNFDQQAEIDWLLESVPQTGGGMSDMNGNKQAPQH